MIMMMMMVLMMDNDDDDDDADADDDDDDDDVNHPILHGYVLNGECIRKDSLFSRPLKRDTITFLLSEIFNQRTLCFTQ